MRVAEWRLPVWESRRREGRRNDAVESLLIPDLRSESDEESGGNAEASASRKRAQRRPSRVAMGGTGRGAGHTHLAVEHARVLVALARPLMVLLDVLAAARADHERQHVVLVHFAHAPRGEVPQPAF